MGTLCMGTTRKVALGAAPAHCFPACDLGQATQLLCPQLYDGVDNAKMVASWDYLGMLTRGTLRRVPGPE